MVNCSILTFDSTNNKIISHLYPIEFRRMRLDRVIHTVDAPIEITKMNIMFNEPIYPITENNNSNFKPWKKLES